MNRKRLVLYLIFVVYQTGAFAFTYLVDGHLDLLGLLKFIPWFKYIAFIGLLMIVVDIAWYFIEIFKRLFYGSAQVCISVFCV